MCTSPAATRGKSKRLAQRLEQLQATRIEAAGQELHPYPQTPCKTFAQPTAVRLVPWQRHLPVRGSQMIKHPSSAFSRSVRAEPIAALGAGAPRPADQAAQGAVGGAIGGECHELEVIGERISDADDQRQSMLLGGDVGAHHAGQASIRR